MTSTKDISSMTDQDKNIIGSILREELYNPGASASYLAIIRPEFFESALAKQAFDAICRLNNAGKRIDGINFIEELKQLHVYDEDKISGSIIAEFYDAKTSLASVANWVENCELATKRKDALRKTESLKKAILNNDMDAFWQATNELKDFYEGVGRFDIERAVWNVLDSVQAVTAIPTGFYELSRKIGGWRKNVMYTFFGHPGHGKTAMALNFANNLLDIRKKTLFVSSEESVPNVLLRYIALRARVSAFNLSIGKLDDAGWGKITQCKNLADKNLVVVNAYTVPEIFKAVLTYSPEILIVDHLHSLRPPSAESMNASVSLLMTGLLALTHSEPITTILMAQTRKSPDRKKRPNIDELYYSKEIEFFSAYCTSLHWPFKAFATGEEEPCFDENDYEVYVQKARLGHTGKIEMRIDPETLFIAEKSGGYIPA